MQNPPLAVDRAIIAAALVLTAVLFLPSAADPVNVVKVSALVLGAIALLALAAFRLVRTRVATVPAGPAAIAAVVLLLAFVAAALRAPVATTAVLGAYGRNSGLLAYASVLVLFLVGVRVFDRRSAWVPLAALIGAGLFTASYGLLQYVGVDAIAWANPFNPIIAALGNPNFAAAYLGICVPAAAWGALSTRWPTGWRIASGVTAGLCLVVAVLTGSAQGPLAAAAGLAVLAVAWLLGRPATQRRVGIAVLGVAGLAGTALVIAGIAGLLNLGLADEGTRARQWYWEGALSMWRDNPVLGVGLEMFGGYWASERPVEAVRQLGSANFTDAAHSVPLHLLATGGLVLALTYAAFVGVVLGILVLGLRRLQGEERLLLGGLGGAWTAYQVQSLISIDQVPLTVTQYVLAAAIVVAAGQSRLREVRLPGAPPAQGAAGPAQRSRRGKSLAPRRRRATPVDNVLTGVVVLVALAMAWFALVPLRANLAAFDGDVALGQGDGAAAAEAYDRATSLVPGESTYWLRQARLFERGQQPSLARRSLERAVAEDPFSLTALRAAASLAAQEGDTQRARQLYDRALELDPYGEETLVAATSFLIDQNEAGSAAEVLERAVEVLPNSADLWAQLGRARAALGDDTGALDAYERALEIDPEQATANTGIGDVRPPGP